VATSSLSNPAAFLRMIPQKWHLSVLTGHLDLPILRIGRGSLRGLFGEVNHGACYWALQDRICDFSKAMAALGD